MKEVVLVTGAYGFVGRHLARALAARGAHVVGIGHGSWGSDEWRRWGLARWHTADVTVETLTTYGGDPDLVFHCAGSGSVAFSMAHPQQDLQRTVVSTLAVLEYLRLHRSGARLVIPSSAGVYGVAARLPISTDAALRPSSPYGVHKKMAEELCRSYAQHFGIRSALVRLFSVYGIGIRKQLLWDACAKLSRGVASFAGTGLETRDWLHVEDAAQLMLIAAQHASTTCPVVNGGEGQAVSICDVVELIATRLGNSPCPTFSGEVRAGDPTHYQADVSGALAWGWVQRHDRVREMNAYVDWYLAGAA
ncbi:MAG: NAD-dependent epimerase/dehydratase family protein [Glaciimonas sp.]|nr:NAD-dependent epimerase/dehydratase family protein [Glaciimonas sp.]